MQFAFEEFVLDTRKGELRRGEEEQPLEPRAFGLLCLLVENHDRLVSKDEILEKVWDGRVVTDSAVSTVIKTVRKALGDDGDAQKYVRTVRGRGFRFVAPIRILADGQATPPEISILSAGEPIAPEPAAGDRPSIAILPFAVSGFSDTYSAIGDAIPTELISSLSRLRWLRVIARGSSFRFRQREVDPNAVRAALGVGYSLSGSVEIFGNKLTTIVELVDVNSHDVIWGERFATTIDDIHQTREQIVGDVIAALEVYIPRNEADKATVSSPDALDAWSAFHIGLQHMYRFNKNDNAIAAAHFERATTMDPGFARAFAARSFTSFQNAFLKYSADAEADAENARRFAERGVELDPLDPFANFNLARTHWLTGDPDGGLENLRRAIEVNPNFAHGHYARAWVDAMAGRGAEGLDNADTAITLSPLDPLLYAMHATRAFSGLLMGDYESAATWAERGARSPGSHFLIAMFAVAAHHLNGNLERARHWARNVSDRRNDGSIEHFFTAFPFSDNSVRKEISQALTAHGVPSSSV